MVDDPEALAAKIPHAGAIFLGAWTPEAIGDYVGGSNHVLPTGGCACHSSGLSVQSFLRGIHVVTYSADALREVGAADRALRRCVRRGMTPTRARCWHWSKALRGCPSRC